MEMADILILLIRLEIRYEGTAVLTSGRHLIWITAFVVNNIEELITVNSLYGRRFLKLHVFNADYDFAGFALMAL